MMWKFLRNRYKKELGNSLCLAKWTQSNIYLAAGTTHSCHHPIPHTIPIEEIKDNPSGLHNTQYKIEQRKKMLDGNRPSECDYCWRVEDTGHISDRITKSFASWSRPYFDDIISDGAEKSIPRYLEVSFDNTCNLKCSYCGPTYSSKWVEELKQFGDWKNHHSQQSVILNNEYNPYIEAFWKWWPEIQKELHTFRITGGEPLLSKHTYKIIKSLKENPNTKLVLGVNTNLSVPRDIIKKFVREIKDLKVKQLVIHTSCDAYGSAAEYARNGLNYKEWFENCKYILKEIPNVKLDVMVTYSAFSVTTFKDLLKDINAIKTPWYKRSKVSVSIGYLRNPYQLAVWLLPISYITYIEDQIKFMKNNNFSSAEINQLERIETLVKEFGGDRKNLQHLFREFVDEHDRRRGTNFLNSVPNMDEIYHES